MYLSCLKTVIINRCPNKYMDHNERTFWDITRSSVVTLSLPTSKLATMKCNFFDQTVFFILFLYS